MKKDVFTGIEIAIVILVLGVFTLSLFGTTSYAFKDRSNDYLDEIEHVIIKQAELYGKSLSNLKEEGSLMITLNDLIDNGYYIADSDGYVKDPRNNNAHLNGLRIKLIYKEDGNIKAEVLEEE